MQDLAGLRIGKRIGGLGLIEGEAAQYAARDLWRPPQHLQGGDQPVAAECRRIPGNAGIRVTALRRIRHQHRQIGGGAAQDLVEAIVGRLDRRAFERLRAHFAPRRDHAAQERQRSRLCLVATCSEKQRPHFSGRKCDPVDGGVWGQPVGRRIEGQCGATQLVIESFIKQENAIGALQFGGCDAAPVAVRAAHLEQVGKIVVE